MEINCQKCFKIFNVDHLKQQLGLKCDFCSTIVNLDRSVKRYDFLKVNQVLDRDEARVNDYEALKKEYEIYSTGNGGNGRYGYACC